VLQLQIETEGRSLHTAAVQQLACHSTATNNQQGNKGSSRHGKFSAAEANKRLQRWNCNLEALEQRWRNCWLASLENAELINAYIEKIQVGVA